MSNVGNIKLEVGQRVGKWTLLEETSQRCNSGQILWRCRCDCGNESLKINN